MNYFYIIILISFSATINISSFHSLTNEKPNLDENANIVITVYLSDDIEYNVSILVPNSTNDSLEILLNLGYASFEDGNLEEAETYFTKAIEIDSTDERPFFLRGLVYKRLGQIENAISDFSTTVKLNPNNDSAHFLKGTLERERENLVAALADLNAAIIINDTTPQYFEVRGLIKHGLSDLDGAIQDFTKVITLLNPLEQKRVFGLRGNSKIKNGDFQGAINDFNIAIKEVKDKELFFNRGLAKKKSGDFQGAIADYSRAIELDGKFISAYSERALANFFLKNFKRTVQDLTTIILLNEHDKDAYSARGVAKDMLGDFKGAISDFSKAIELSDTIPNLYLHRAISKQKIGDFNGAIVDYQTVSRLNPDNEISNKFISELERIEEYIGSDWVNYFLKDETNPVIPFPERMTNFPLADSYVAFSLKNAKRLIKQQKEKNYRTKYPEVFGLGGINKIEGVIYDNENEDIIIVGRYFKERQALTLDDLVVALRSIFIYKTYPLVSIDPSEDYAVQKVRLEGGIENTQLAADLLRADYKSKLIALGIYPSLVSEVPSLLDLGLLSGEPLGYSIKHRFWFYPSVPYISVKKDVAAFKNLKVSVFTEIESIRDEFGNYVNIKDYSSHIPEEFAKRISDNFDSLAEKHSSFARLQGLEELVALTSALEKFDEKPDLSYWFNEYEIKKVIMPKTIQVIRRNENNRIISGGVRLMALAIRLKGEYSDALALKDAVLEMRPSNESLSWSFYVGDWVFSAMPGSITENDLNLLLQQGSFFTEQKRYDAAIDCYTTIISILPDNFIAYNSRASVYYYQGAFDKAMADLTFAIKIFPDNVVAYNNRATLKMLKHDYKGAVEDCNHAISKTPIFSDIYINRGWSYFELGQFELAIEDFTSFIELSNSLDESMVYFKRAVSFASIGQFEKANSDIDSIRQIKVNPFALTAKGYIHLMKKENIEAIKFCNAAIRMAPFFDYAYYVLGLAYSRLDRYEEAIENLNYAKELGYNSKKITQEKDKIFKIILDY